MKLIKLNEVGPERDVVEFLYRHNSEHLWNEDSLYISYEDFSFLAKSLDSIKKFNCYGPNIITISQWNEIRDKVSMPENAINGAEEILQLFSEVDEWINLDPKKADYFIIDGI